MEDRAPPRLHGPAARLPNDDGSGEAVRRSGSGDSEETTAPLANPRPLAHRSAARLPTDGSGEAVRRRGSGDIARPPLSQPCVDRRRAGAPSDAEPVPVSTYVGSSKNLKDLKDDDGRRAGAPSDVSLGRTGDEPRDDSGGTAASTKAGLAGPLLEPFVWNCLAAPTATVSVAGAEDTSELKNGAGSVGECARTMAFDDAM
ncbi:hypothetical protein T484DRAFT_1832318 [Baffinella frigidus]|nr:hypothetical protein T484DRAFT_1832318 [Cryptophyta sp. CCMP2293]